MNFGPTYTPIDPTAGGAVHSGIKGVSMHRFCDLPGSYKSIEQVRRDVIPFELRQKSNMHNWFSP